MTGRHHRSGTLVYTEADFIDIKESVGSQGGTKKLFIIRWIDHNQLVHAEIERQCYIAGKKFYISKKGDTQSAKLKFKQRNYD